MKPPLLGVTVVAVEQAVAGPFATRQLADLGARVITKSTKVAKDDEFVVREEHQCRPI